ncbi:hypothetical protein D3C76_1818730 [compost metagenome]
MSVGDFSVKDSSDAKNGLKEEFFLSARFKIASPQKVTRRIPRCDTPAARLPGLPAHRSTSRIALQLPY